MTDYIKSYKNPTDIYHREAIRLTERLSTDMTIMDGIPRWNSNNHVIPSDCAELAAYIGLPVDLVASDKARDADTKAFLAAYRANYTGPSDEERFEARAAHGAGVELVDMITGHKWTT